MARAHYVTVSGGQMGLAVAGAGPVIIVLPGLTEAACILADRCAAAHPDRTWIAFDLPGTGGSAGLAGGDLSSAAASLAQAIASLGLRGTPVLACDLSIALAAALPPATVGPLTVTGSARARAWSARGLAPSDLSPRGDGAHLTAFWAHVRDALILDPEDPLRPGREGPPLPSPDDLHAFATRAMVVPEGYAALWRACLGALPALPDRDEAQAWAACHAASAAHTRAPGIPAPEPHGDLWCEHVDTPEGRLHVRRSGTRGRPLFVLQSAPGSTAPLSRLIRHCGGTHRVYAIDFPGNGDSDKPTGGMDIARIARAIWAAAEAFGLDHLDLWGTHTGALVALEMALQRPASCGRLVLEAPPLLPAAFTQDILANYLPPLVPDRWGLHLQQAWNMRRDMFLFWPWYRQEREAGRALGLPDPRFLHDWTLGLLKSGRTYDLSYRAAFEYPTLERLPGLSRPALVCAGPTDMLVDGLETAKRSAPGLIEVAATPATVWYPNQDEAGVEATLARYAAFLSA